MKTSLKPIKWLSILALFAIIAPLVTACGTKDIDKRMFVVAVGIDKSDNEEKPYEVTIKVPIPSNKKASQAPNFIYLTEIAGSISEALHILTSHVDKNLEFGHTKFIIFGENIIEEDLRVVVDIFLRRREFQQTAWLTVARPSAKEALKATSSTNIPDINIMFNRFSNIGTESSYIVSTFLFDFRRKIGENGINPILPIMEINENNTNIIVNKSIIIAEDKTRLELSPEQTEDYNTLTNQTKTINLDIQVKEDNTAFTVYVDAVNVKYKILTPTNQKPVIKMKVDMVGLLQESTTLTDRNQLATYNKLASEVFKERALNFLKLLQTNEVDPIGFGLRYEATRLHNRDLVAEWKEIYPEITFDVTVNMVIKSLGSIQ